MTVKLLDGQGEIQQYIIREDSLVKIKNNVKFSSFYKDQYKIFHAKVGVYIYIYFCLFLKKLKPNKKQYIWAIKTSSIFVWATKLGV